MTALQQPSRSPEGRTGTRGGSSSPEQWDGDGPGELRSRWVPSLILIPVPEQEQFIPGPQTPLILLLPPCWAQPLSPPPSPSPSKERFLPLLAALIPSFHGTNCAFLLAHRQTFSFRLLSHIHLSPSKIPRATKSSKTPAAAGCKQNREFHVNAKGAGKSIAQEKGSFCFMWSHPSH